MIYLRPINTVVIALLIILSSNNAYAKGYHQMKSEAENGNSAVYELFLDVHSDMPLTVDSPREKHTIDLSAEYFLMSSRNIEDQIQYLYPLIEYHKVERFISMDKEHVLKLLESGVSDTDIIHLVLARSKRIQKAKKQWEASLNLYPQTLYLQNLMTSFNSFSRGLPINTGSEYHKEMIQMYHSSPGMLSLRGKVVNIDVEIAWLDYIKEIRDTIADSELIMAEIRRNEELIEINRESARLLETLNEIIEAQYKSGMRSFSDLVRIKNERDKRRDTVNRLESMEEGLNAKLVSALDLPASSISPSISWTKEIEQSFDIADLAVNLVETNQELAQIKLRIELMEAMIAMSRLRAAPDPTLGFTYFQGTSIPSMEMMDSESMSMDSMNFMNRPMVDYRNHNLASDLAWSYELIDRKNAHDEMLTAESNMSEGMLIMLNEKYQSLIETEQVYSKVIIPDAKAALSVVRAGYSAGNNDFNDLTNAEIALLMAQMELSNISYERRESLIEIKRLIGRDTEIALNHESEKGDHNGEK